MIELVLLVAMMKKETQSGVTLRLVHFRTRPGTFAILQATDSVIPCGAPTVFYLVL